MDRSLYSKVYDYSDVLLPGAVLIILALPNSLLAATWNVRADGTGDAPAIQTGIDSAGAGDTVLVGPGTYLENINFLGKDIVLVSEFGPGATTIDGSQGNQPVVRFQNQETRAAVIEGFTITGGQGTRDFGSPRGGGILCIRSSPTIKSNWIIRNQSTLDDGTGGGMAIGTGLVDVPKAAPLVEQNRFEANAVSGNGGALSIEHSDAIVTDNTFEGNSAAYDGGAIRAYFVEGSTVLTNNRFIENEAGDHGGGVYVAFSPQVPATIEIAQNLFFKNTAMGVGASDSGSGGGIYLYAVSGLCSNNTIVSNIGFGESPSSGGGVLLHDISSELELARNIIAYNEGSGIACRGNAPAQIWTNLLWQNRVGDIGGPGSDCKIEWLASQLVANPAFCDSSGNDFSLASDSPAFGKEVMGAYPEPGCGPTAALRTTWGRLKVVYR